jgi:hypothetical protein
MPNWLKSTRRNNFITTAKGFHALQFIMHSLHLDGHASAGGGDRRMSEAYGTRAPGWLDRTVIAVTSRLPKIWLGLRRIGTMCLTGDDSLDVVLWELRLRLHPRRNGCEKGALFTPQMYEIPERKELFADINKAKAASRVFQCA